MNYWMIRIFFGKSGSVSFLGFSSPNLMYNIKKILTWEIEKTEFGGPLFYKNGHKAKTGNGHNLKFLR